MKNLKTTSVLLLIFVVGACGPMNIEPAVSSFNEASVGIQLDGNAMEFSSAAKRAEAITKADAEAAKICQRGPNRKAEYASSRRIPTGQYSYVIERLYLCLR
ncbi:MAG: hypothetical protein JJU24_15150 [Natronohydrobacter sp.]|nr:hypothetical protein [Natronohydrobacter sp.]